MKRTIIYGGCVSGDLGSLYQPQSLCVVRYVARQSLLSAFSDATDELPCVNLASAFQSSMAQGDIAGNLVSLISEELPFDVLLWDLNIERCGVWILPSGAIVTNSVELRKSAGMLEAISNGRFLGFGSDRHFEEWASATKRFEIEIKRLGVQPKIIVLAPDWATHDELGKRTSKSHGLSAASANRKFARYFAHLESLGFKVLRFENVVADSHHKWGPAPFHYSRSTYAQMHSRIKKELKSSSS